MVLDGPELLEIVKTTWQSSSVVVYTLEVAVLTIVEKPRGDLVMVSEVEALLWLTVDAMLFVCWPDAPALIRRSSVVRGECCDRLYRPSGSCNQYWHWVILSLATATRLGPKSIK